MDVLIRQALVQDGQPCVDIAIHKGHIVDIRAGIDTSAACVIHAEGRAAIPGLLEPHVHLDKALLDARAPNYSGTLEEAIRVTGALKKQQTREDILGRSRRVLD